MAGVDWKSIVGAVAPTIGTALGGPLGGMAAQALTSALGIKADAKEPEIARAMASATPDQLLAIKRAEIEFQERMLELDIDLERIAADDRDSARQREVQTRDWMPKVLALLVIAGFLATVAGVLSGYVDGLRDPIMSTTVGTVIGFVSAKAEQVIAYYFGSSAGSRAKDTIIANGK
jgi:hypothetical protein